MRIKQLSILIVYILFGLNSSLNAKDITIKQPNTWVYVNTFDNDLSHTKENVEGGVYYLLVDGQYNSITKEQYKHIVIKVLTETGVQNNSDLWIDYEPSFQKLTFHKIKIYRNNKTINKLNINKIKTVQNESELDNRIYNGTNSAGLFIEGVKPGDIIEYSYTISGENPILEGSISKMLPLQYGVPVKRIYQSIIYPKNTYLNYKLFKTNQEPVKKEDNNTITLIWDIKEAKEVLANIDIPSWYNPYASAQISSFKTWAELAEWGEKLYKVKTISDKKLTNELNQILKGSLDNEDKIGRIIRFVQDDIRYVGIEVNEYSYKPHNPIDVYRKRFGDCKDKSYLLITLLNKIGVESYIAYVNTDLKHKVSNYLPSPTMFNHAIVAIKYNDKIHFVDPTISNQRGSFKNFYNYNYGKAIILNSKIDNLSSIDLNSNEKISIKETYEVFDSINPVLYKIISVYHNGEADKTRQNFKNGSKKEIEMSYLNFYGSDFPDMDINNELTYNDNEKLNIFEVTEDYKINSFWQFNDFEDIQDFTCKISANNLVSYITVPKEKNRDMPFYIYYPIEIKNEITLKNAKEIDLNQQDIEINNPSFKFSFKLEKTDNKTLVFKYYYKSLKDHVTAAEVQQYLRDINKISDFVYFEFTWGKEDKYLSNTSEFNWLLLVIVLLFVIILIIILFSLYKKDRNIPLSEPTPIGGWLVLVAIGVVLSPIIIGYQVYIGEYFELGPWQFISNRDSEGFNALWSGLYVFEILINSFFVVYSAFLTILLIGRRTIFPNHYIAFRLINITMLIIHLVLSYQIDSIYFEFDNSAYNEITKTVIGSAIWIPYILLSKRVKSTFVVKTKKNTLIDLAENNDILEPRQ